MVTIKDGDLFSAPEGIICHQVNCKGNMGRGVAKTFRLVFPQAYNKYLGICRSSINPLGRTMFCIEDTGESCCMFAQNDWRGNGCNTDYAAFRSCCKEIKERIDLCENKDKPINMPFGIGCGLGGGDWIIIKSILEEEFENYNVILWKLK